MGFLAPQHLTTDAVNSDILSINPLSVHDPLTGLSLDDRAKFHAFGWGIHAAPRFSTVHLAIEHQIAVQPAALAAKHLENEITYGELSYQADKLAARLKLRGVTRGDAVCVYMHRSIPMVVAILATMRLGAAYVPQHVGVAPADMLEHIAEVTRAKAILTLAGMQAALPFAEHEMILVDKVISEDQQPDRTLTNERHSSVPEDVAVILFTSGTTGVPNGVPVTQRNLANILLTSPGDLGMRPGLRVGQILSIAFDMAAWETLGALANGATLVLRGKSIQETAEEVDILIATPSILASLDADRCRNVKVAAVAGEPCPRALADLWGSFCQFYNSCGPTETTIINTAEPHFPEKPVLSIGRPTPNNTVYILDDDLTPLPIGAKGEMWAGGDCVTSGYIGNSELTEERYKPDPFRPGHFMFRTRDVGRWTETGELEHFGRVDDVVKIRGFRVELNSVSSILEDAGACMQALTLRYDDRHLVSFVTPASIDVDAAVAAVASKLPYYCVPKAIIPLEIFPRTPRGKLDKPLLLEMARQLVGARDDA